MAAPTSTPAASGRSARPQTPGTIREFEAVLLRRQSRLMRWLRRVSGNFWREFLYFWTSRAPLAVLWTRPFFLWFAYRYSAVLRDGPGHNARRLLGPNASPREVEELRREIIGNAYLNVYELGASLKRSVPETRARIWAIEGREAYLAARQFKRGAVLVTAHFGPFEVGAAALLDLERNISVVFRRDERASFDSIRSRLRAKLGISEIPVDDGWNIWVSLRDALLRDEVVLIMGDRVMPGHRGIKMPFLGGHIRVPTGPVKLARVSGAPLIPIFTIRTATGRLKVIIEEPVFVSPESDAAQGKFAGDSSLMADDSRRGSLQRGDDAALRAIVGALEKQVRDHPAQWMVFYRAWCEDEFISENANGREVHSKS